MAEKKNYSDYTFRPKSELLFPVELVQQLKEFAQEVVKDNTESLTKARFQKLNKKTGKVAKGKVKNENDYETVFSPQTTIEASPDYYFTELAKTALLIEDLINKQVVKNIDNGRGILKEDYEKELKEVQKPNLEKVD